MTKAELAVSKYKSGYNCAQSVVCSFAEELGMDESVLYKMAEGFGAGMGSGMGPCGAMAGVAMLSGLANSDGDIAQPGQTKAKSTRMSASLTSEFIEKIGALYCKDIKIGVDGHSLSSCADCIRTAVELAERAYFSL